MAMPQPLQLLAPLSGLLLPLEQVPDPVFSSRIMGDGLCIDPTSQTLCAPLAGVISNLQHSGHALSISAEQGQQVLLHIGLDTVNLAGQGFTCLVTEGQSVKPGQPLIRFDADYLALHARSLLTLMLVVSGEAITPLGNNGPLVEQGQPLLELAPASGEAEQTAAEGQTLLSQPLILGNAQGLHARPAALLAQAAKGFSAKLALLRGQDSANAKSVVSIMALQSRQGDSLQVSATGEDAEQAIETLVALLASGCGEQIAPPPASIPPVQPGELPQRLLRGVCASAGVAYGKVLQLREQPLDISEHAANPQAEHEALQRALQQAAADLQEQRNTASSLAQQGIFQAHQQLLDDPTLLEQAASLIDQGKSAAFAWNSAIQTTAGLFKALGSTLLAERAVDLADIGQRVLRLLLGLEQPSLILADQVILLAEQLTPSQTASLDTSKVLGFATVAGGATSHGAILARALGLPAICGLPAALLALADGTEVLLDADHGLLYCAPEPALRQEFEARQRLQRKRQQEDLSQASLPAVTRDGHHLEVSANIASLAEAKQAVSLGAEGVGLLRSEFLYQDRSQAPSPEEQATTYQAIARVLGAKRKLIVRTLDVGGDKPLAYVPMETESNPFLGLRGIRLCLERPELLREQFRAILTSLDLTCLHIMLPMVSQLAELRQARQLLEEAALALGLSQRPRLGIMIEVPSAALLADRLAPEVDFFSIGTNDLTQYTLAMDRDHPRLASQADSLHPAVLRLIASTVQAAHRHGKWVGVCGALASEALATPLLLGLGVDELSVSTPLIPAIKARVRELNREQCQSLASRLVDLDDATQVRQQLQNYLDTTLSGALEN